jgi:protein gp37
MAKRLQAMGQPRYRNGFRVTLQPDLLEEPLKWRKPRMVFVNSMSDLLHEAVPLDFIQTVFETMRAADNHIFQVLTKRAARLARIQAQLDWPSNVWIGVTVEARDYARRIDRLRSVPATVRFVSFEPLLDRVGPVSLEGIHWAIVGGESGPGARPTDISWVREIRNACSSQNVQFFFKQWGGRRKWETGRELDGRTWDDFPAGVAVSAAS